MKKLIFVSTGRCGTRRIAQILREKLSDSYSVVHQMRYSRLANIIGNMMLYMGESNTIKRSLYKFIVSRYNRRTHFVSTDPLTAMIIPEEYVSSPEICIVHINRDDTSFARSFLSFSRSRLKSFIAHNLCPFWQPGVWPLENIFNRNIDKKYRQISKLKNTFFFTRYSLNPNYCQVNMTDIFTTPVLQGIVNDFFAESISISPSDLSIRANESRNSPQILEG
jgi:hypothetical protein